MNNVELMKKVIELDTQTLHTREQSLRVMIQLSIIRKAFAVKNGETNARIIDVERKRVLANHEIDIEFKRYVGFWTWAIQTNNPDKANTFEQQVRHFIEGVRFFDDALAQQFTGEFANMLFEHASADL